MRVCILRKRFYILFVARDAEGQLRKIPIPIHYLYVFLAGALIGMFTITGMAGSYTRMLWKVASFNQLRLEKTALQTRYAAAGAGEPRERHPGRLAGIAGQ